MTIQVGDKLPEAKFRVMTADGLQVKTTDDIFKGKKVALFAVPGAYTGTCHKMHLPGIFLNAYAIKNKGVDTIAIVSVNDAFVMNAWKRDTDQRDEAVFLADGNAEFTKAIDMESMIRRPPPSCKPRLGGMSRSGYVPRIQVTRPRTNPPRSAK